MKSYEDIFGSRSPRNLKRNRLFDGHVPVEQGPHNPRAAGSNPTRPTSAPHPFEARESGASRVLGVVCTSGVRLGVRERIVYGMAGAVVVGRPQVGVGVERLP